MNCLFFVCLIVLVSVVVILVLLLIVAIFIICRYFVCRKSLENHQYSKLESPYPTKTAQIPKIPDLRSFQYSLAKINNKNNRSSFSGVNEDDVSTSLTESTEQTFYAVSNNNQKQPFMSSDHLDKEQYIEASYESNENDDDLFPFDETQSNKSTDNIFNEIEDASISSDSQPSNSSKLTKKTRIRFRSEPILNREYNSNSPFKYDNKKQRSMSTPKSNPTPPCTNTPAKGCIEFSLFYEPSRKDLIVTVVQLLDIVMKPEIFTGILNIVNRSEQKHLERIHLIRHSDGSLRFSDNDIATGYLVYVSLLPKKRISKHTDVVFGKGNMVFNEKFVFSGYTPEQLSQHFICIYVLCKFDQEDEPIVLGEVKVPLKRLQTSQLLPFMANLSHVEEELVLTVSLDCF